jgi:hypothetical protein
MIHGMSRSPVVGVVIVALVIAAIAAIGCTPERIEWQNEFSGEGEDLFVLDDDLNCLGDDNWVEVNGTRVTNLLDHQDEAVAVAQEPAEGAAFPVGTILQLGADEAMVKRGAGFSADTADWEFLQLHVASGRTVITGRGTTELANPAGTCLSCHTAAKDFDLVCFTNSTCAPLPFFIDTDIDPTTDDPRCR